MNGLVAAAAVLALLVLAAPAPLVQARKGPAPKASITDYDILNFALNLEYLEVRSQSKRPILMLPPIQYRVALLTHQATRKICLCTRTRPNAPSYPVHPQTSFLAASCPLKCTAPTPGRLCSSRQAITTPHPGDHFALPCIHTLRHALTHVCNIVHLEPQAEFYSWAAFGKGLPPSLRGYGPAPVGGKKAKLSPEAQAYAEQIALVSRRPAPCSCSTVDRFSVAVKQLHNHIQHVALLCGAPSCHRSA